jgi:hypothetical protein
MRTACRRSAESGVQLTACRSSKKQGTVAYHRPRAASHVNDRARHDARGTGYALVLVICPGSHIKICGSYGTLRVDANR